MLICVRSVTLRSGASLKLG